MDLQDGESVTDAVFSADGMAALVIGDEGSVQMTTDGGETWRKEVLNLPKFRWRTDAVLSVDGMSALVTGDEGLVYMTTDGGKTWSETTLEVEGEQIAVAGSSVRGTHALVVSRQGSVHMTTDGGNGWSQSVLELEDGERVSRAVFAIDGMAAFAIGDEGSVYMTTDGGKEWTAQKLKLENEQQVVFAILGTNIKSAVLLATSFSVSVRPDVTIEWIPTELKLGPEDGVGAVAFTVKTDTGVVVTDQGLAAVMQSGGKNWRLHTFELTGNEEVTSATWATDGISGLVAGNRGSAFLTTDRGARWRSTKGLDHMTRTEFLGIGRTVKVSSHDSGFVAATPDGYYVLVKYPELDGWRKWPLERIRNELSRNKTLSDSTISQELDKLVTDGGFDRKRIASQDTPEADEEGSEVDEHLDDGNPSDDEWSIRDIVDDATYEVTVMRIVTVAVVFFLAQILIRLSQYSVRLAAFWDSRADAVLLKQSLAVRKVKRFDSLVNALSPDAYDFNPPPRSPFEGFRLQRRVKISK